VVFLLYVDVEREMDWDRIRERDKMGERNREEEMQR